MIQTGTSNRTIWIENGEEVYPCPCGETHRGPYGFYSYGWHTCPHGDVLWDLGDVGILCSQCGATVGFLEGKP